MRAGALVYMGYTSGLAWGSQRLSPWGAAWGLPDQAPGWRSPQRQAGWEMLVACCPREALRLRDAGAALRLQHACHGLCPAPLAGRGRAPTGLQAGITGGEGSARAPRNVCIQKAAMDQTAPHWASRLHRPFPLRGTPIPGPCHPRPPPPVHPPSPVSGQGYSASVRVTFKGVQR